MNFDPHGEHDPRHSLGDLDPELRHRLAALDEPVSWADWSDVLKRRARFALSSRLVVTLFATLVVSAVAATTVLLTDGHGTRTGAAAPTRAFQQFTLAAPPIAPQAIASQTRMITSARLQGSERTLYVAPATGGGFCYEWTGSQGRCEKLTSSVFSIAWGSPHLVLGTVSSPLISSVKIEFTDGTTAEPSVSWISAPINAGFFLYDVPAGKTVATIDMA